jgi:excisionase family DNA binding protein
MVARSATNPDPLLLTVRQAARALALCDKTLHELTKRGELPCIRYGRAVRYDVADLRAWIAAKKSTPPVA